MSNRLIHRQAGLRMLAPMALRLYAAGDWSRAM